MSKFVFELYVISFKENYFFLVWLGIKGILTLENCFSISNSKDIRPNRSKEKDLSCKDKGMIKDVLNGFAEKELGKKLSL